MRLAGKMANITFSVIARACNKMIIGKTLEKCGTTKGPECGCCDGVDQGGGEANAESGK